MIRGKTTTKRIEDKNLDNGMQSKKCGRAGQGHEQAKKENTTLAQSSEGNKFSESAKATNTNKGTAKSPIQSSAVPERRNGHTHEPVFLRVSPISSDVDKTRSRHFPSSPPQDSVGRLLARERTEERRETLCQKTDEFAKKRVVVRVLMKKF